MQSLAGNWHKVADVFPGAVASDELLQSYMRGPQLCLARDRKRFLSGQCHCHCMGQQCAVQTGCIGETPQAQLCLDHSSEALPVWPCAAFPEDLLLLLCLLLGTGPTEDMDIVDMPRKKLLSGSLQ